MSLLLILITSSIHADEVTLEKAKYSDLVEAVNSSKGKVILVDFWSTTCIPCMKKFPNMVALHNRFARFGLKVISVSIDPKDNSDLALKFLKQQKATFQNLLLDEKPIVLQNKLRISEIPCYYLFDRQGRIERRVTDSMSKTELTKLIQRLLNEKP